MAHKTQVGGTVTTEGWIPHLRHHKTNILMPVKIKQVCSEDLGETPIPLRRHNRLVYALPGGREYLDL